MSEDARSVFATFSSLRDQPRAVEALRRELEQDRVHHAHLLTGPDGVGKGLLARAWASRLLCPKPQGVDACGTCASCLKLKAGAHPDLVVIEPDGRFIKIDQIRALTEMTRYRPNEGRWRVVIMERVEQLNEAGANALLKTLEEPSGNTLFVLLTSMPNRVLATIRSRCVPLRLAALEFETCAEILVGAGVEPQRAQVLARMAGGSPGAALAMANSPAVAERGDAVRNMVAIARGDLVRGIEWASSLSLVNERELLEERLHVWTGMLRDAAVLSSTKERAMVHHQDILPDLELLVRALPLKSIYDWIDALERALTRLAGNVQPRLLAESLMIDFSTSARAI